MYIETYKVKGERAYNFKKSFRRALAMNGDKPLTLEELLKHYDPTPVEYDPHIDGDDEHRIRDDHLEEKERLKSVVEKLKEKQRKDIKVRR